MVVRGLVVSLVAAVALVTVPAAAEAKDRRVFRAAAAGDFIDVNSRHERVWRAWPKNMKTIALGDIVHKNSPRRLWVNEWETRWGGLPVCQVWGVLGNHGWGWSGRGRFEPARGRTYREFQGRPFLQNCPTAMSDRYQWAKRRPGWLLLGLNTESCSQATSFMRQATNRWPKRHVAVFTHRPPLLPPRSSAPPLRCPSLDGLIRQRADVVLSGHSHRFWRQGKYHVAGTGDGKGYAVVSLYRSGRWNVDFKKVGR